MSRSRAGFTLIETLLVVLIVGLLASIAIPVFNGQRDKAKDRAAVSALRSGILAARAFHIGNNENFSTFTAADIKSNEQSLYRGTTEEPFGAGDSPGASAEPTKIAVADASSSSSGFNATLGSAADTTADNPITGSNAILLCSVSKGDGIFCAKVDLTSTGKITWKYYSLKALGTGLALNDKNGSAAGATPIQSSDVTGTSF